MGNVEAREQFGSNVRRYRGQLKVSQEELGHRCGLHRTEISLLERGGRDPRLETIVRLARGLEVRPADLLSGLQ